MAAEESNALNKQINLLQSSIKSKDRSIERKDKDIAEIQKVLKTKEVLINRLNLNITEKEEEIRNLKSQPLSLKHDILPALQEDTPVSDKTVTALENELKESKTELQNMRLGISGLKNYIKVAYRNELNKLRFEIVESVKENKNKLVDCLTVTGDRPNQTQSDLIEQMKLNNIKLEEEIEQNNATINKLQHILNERKDYSERLDEIAEQEATIGYLQESLQEKENELSNIELKTSMAFEEKITSQQNELAEKERTISQLRKDLLEKGNVLPNYHTDIMKTINEISVKLQNDLSKKDEEINLLKKELKEKETIHSEEKDNRKNLEIKMQQMVDIVTDVREQISEKEKLLTNKLQILKENNSGLKKELYENKLMIEQLKAELINKERALQESDTGFFETSQENIAKLKRELDEKENTIIQLQHELLDTKKSLQNINISKTIEESKSEHENKMSEQENKMSECENKPAEMEKTNTQLRNELNKMFECENKLAEMEKTNTQLRNELNKMFECENKLAEMEKTNTQLRNELNKMSECENKLAEIEKTNTQLRNELNKIYLQDVDINILKTVEDINLEFQNKLSEKELVIYKLSKVLDEKENMYSKTIKNMNKENTFLHRELSEQKKNINQTRNEFIKADNVVKRLDLGEMSNLENNKDRFENKMEEKEAIINKLEEELRKNKTLVLKIDKNKEIMDDLQNKLFKQELVINQLRKELNNKENEYSENLKLINDVTPTKELENKEETIIQLQEEMNEKENNSLISIRLESLIFNNGNKSESGHSEAETVNKDQTVQETKTMLVERATGSFETLSDKCVMNGTMQNLSQTQTYPFVKADKYVQVIDKKRQELEILVMGKHNQITILENELRKKTSIIEHLEDEVKSHGRRIAIQQKELEILGLENLKLVEQSAALETEAYQNIIDIQLLKKRLEDKDSVLKSVLGKKSRHISKLNAFIDILKESVASDKHYVKMLKQKQGEHEQRLAEKLNKIESLKSHMDILKRNQEIHKSKIKENDSEIKSPTSVSPYSPTKEYLDFEILIKNVDVKESAFRESLKKKDEVIAQLNNRISTLSKEVDCGKRTINILKEKRATQANFTRNNNTGSVIDLFKQPKEMMTSKHHSEGENKYTKSKTIDDIISRTNIPAEPSHVELSNTVPDNTKYLWLSRLQVLSNQNIESEQLIRDLTAQIKRVREEVTEMRIEKEMGDIKTNQQSLEADKKHVDYLGAEKQLRLEKEALVIDLEKEVLVFKLNNLQLKNAIWGCKLMLDQVISELHNIHHRSFVSSRTASEPSMLDIDTKLRRVIGRLKEQGRMMWKMVDMDGSSIIGGDNAIGRVNGRYNPGRK